MDKAQITAKVAHYWTLATAKFPTLPTDPPAVGFYDRGQAAGRAYRYQHKVEFNAVLAAQEGMRFEDTISHEVAHAAQFILYPRSQAHGREFKGIHRALGGSGRTYHNYNTILVKRHRKGSQVFTCGCEGKLFCLTPDRSLLALVGGCKCRACMVPLKHLGSVEAVRKQQEVAA